MLLCDCILYLVWIAERPSVGRASPPPSRRPSGSFLDRSSKNTPKKMMMKPHISEIVLTGFVVLKPWKRIKDATRTAVVKVT